MPRISAGLLMYRIHEGKFQVLLAHPGGPRFENRDEKAWSIPKGEVEPGEDLLETAKREFEEETGVPPKSRFIPLTPVQQKGGKIVHAWAFEGDCDPRAAVSNTITVEWPRGSGRFIEVPESDRADFFDLELARRKIKVGQEGLIEVLERIVPPHDRPEALPSLQQPERPHWKRAHFLHPDRHGEEPEPALGRLGQPPQMLDDGDFSGEQCRMHRTSSVAGVVDVQRVDADQDRTRSHQKLSGGSGKEGVALEKLVCPPVAVPAGLHQHRLRLEIVPLERRPVDGPTLRRVWADYDASEVG